MLEPNYHGLCCEKTLLLPSDLAKQIKEIAEAEGRRDNAIVKTTLPLTSRNYLKREYDEIQNYSNRKAREKAGRKKKNLRRYLSN